jgi:hypothetical protein
MSAEPAQPEAVRVLLAGVVDYGGTFPPASLDLGTAVRNYARYRAEEASWMLGRFVLPASALDEFETVSAGLLPGGPHASPWPLSVIGGWDLLGDVKRVEAFNARHDRSSMRGRAVVEFIEHRIGKAADVRRIDEKIPVPVRSAYEAPLGPAFAGILKFVKQVDGVAKIRTGGTTPGAIPTVGALAEFLVTCAREKVAVKCAAGLEHAVRGDHPLDVDGTMQLVPQHGLLNVLVASALAWTRSADPTPKDLLMLVETVLDERNPAAFAVTERGIRWWDYQLTCDELQRARRDFLEGVGCACFEEPVRALLEMGVAV